MVCDERLIAVGISHQTASVEDRETLAMAPDAIPALLGRLRDDGFSNEAIILSTCNRTELYTVPGEKGDMERLARWLAESGGATERGISEKIYQKRDQEALRHIFRVASSLDSLVLGEPQIVGQLKTAFRVARECNTAGPMLHRVMDQAMFVSKRVRSETQIAKEAVSIGRAGVELARQVLGSLKGRSALLIGAGGHGKIVARALLDYGLTELVVANRTFDRAARLADEFNGSAVPLQEVARYLDRVDIVVACTSAGKVLISKDELSSAQTGRRGRSLVMIDLAVPRNIDPTVNEVSGVFRFDIDDLAKVADKGQAARREAAALAEDIVEQETERHWRRLLGEQLNLQIGGIVQGAEAIRSAEMERARLALQGLDPQHLDVVDAMTRAIVKKILHQPLRTGRDLAERGEGEQAVALFKALNPGGEDDDG
jgi:glutamyl-tRNA reductase